MIISMERQWHQYTSLWQAIGCPRGRSVSSIQIKTNGNYLEVSGEDAVTNAIILEVHSKHYTLAGNAPICNGPLFHDFGYLSLSCLAPEVLLGTYTNPALDKATEDISEKLSTSGGAS